MKQDGEFNIKAAAALGVRIDSLADIEGLIGAAYSLDGLIVCESDLGQAFFRLSSGVAGELFQKVTNYQIPVALVLSDFSAHGERFAELAFEHARHTLLRFVHTEGEARHWLVSRLQ